MPNGCLDRRSCGYRRGLVGSGGSRRAALSHHGSGFTPGFDARHGPPRGRMSAALPLDVLSHTAGLRRPVDVLTVQPAGAGCLQVQPIDPFGSCSDVQSEVGREQVSIFGRYHTHNGGPVATAASSFSSRTGRFATKRLCRGCTRREVRRRRFQPCGASSPPVTPVPGRAHCAGSSFAMPRNPGLSHVMSAPWPSSRFASAPCNVVRRSARRRCNSATCIVVCCAARERLQPHRPVVWVPSGRKHTGDPPRCWRSRCRCARRSRIASNRIASASGSTHPDQLPSTHMHGHRNLRRPQVERHPPVADRMPPGRMPIADQLHA